MSTKVVGLYMWLWPHGDSFDERFPDPSRTAADLVSLGMTGVIPQDGLAAPRWLAKKGVLEAFTKAGLQVAPGLGMDGQNAHRDNLQKLADAVVACEDVPGRVFTMGNAESAWENDPDDKALANRLADLVLAKRPTPRFTFAPWWAPLFRMGRDGKGKPKKFWTHPSFPYRELGRMIPSDMEIFPQDYGANVPGSPYGKSLEMLAWSRDATQYPKLGFARERVLPATQTYQRSLRDCIDTLLAEPTQLLWDYLGMLENMRLALRVVKRLRELGFVGVDAVRAFQAANSLVVDGLVGPRTLAALGLSAPT